MGQKISFCVWGRPQQRGSKNSFVPLNRKTGEPFRRKNGGVVVSTVDSNKKSKNWMQQVRSAAAEVFRGDLLQGPIRLSARFYFKRPASHFGSGKNAGHIKDSAPLFHTQTPDLSKLLRALEDGITGVVWLDDRQVYRYDDMTGKYWTTGAEMTEVIITEIFEAVA